MGVALALALAVGVGVQAVSASALTSAQVQAIISLLQSFGADQGTIANVQASLTGGTPSTTTGGTTVTGYTFTRDLTLNSTGTDVMNLQKVLNESADTQVAASGAGSPGNESTYFGKLTQAAVIKFQIKNNITPAAGYVGPKTRAVLNAMSSTSTTGGTTTTTGGTTTTTGGTTATTTAGVSGTLMVSSATQPGASLAPQNAARVPFTKITFTAGASDVTVNSLTVQRTGLANDAAFAGIVLLDPNGIQDGVAKTFNSNHQTTLGDPFVVKAGTSVTYTIAGNMASDESGYAGQLASLSVVGVNTSATVSGSLPIVGASQTINSSLTIGTATLYTSSYDPQSELNKNIGTTGVRFSGIKITAGSAEDLTLWSVRWNQTGSAGSSDLANVVTVVNGTSYPTTLSTDGKYYTSLFPNGIVVQKGFSTDIYIQGDIVGSGSANRTVEFDLYNASDLYMTGNTYTYGIIGAANSTGTLSSISRSKFTTSTPFYGGSIVTITGGTVTTISKSATAAPAGNIAVNVPNQVLGAYDTNILGEPISVQSSVFHLSGAPGSLGVPTSVSIVDKNGSVVAGPVDAVAQSGTSQYKVTFTATITYPVGVGTYTIEGTLPSTWTNGATIIASTTPSSDWTTVKGQITGNTLSLTNGLFQMNTMTVRTAALAVSASTNPASQAVVAGAQQFDFMNIQLDATQSGEDVRVSSIPTTLAASSATDISSCQLFNGTTALTTGSNVVNPSATGAQTFTLDQSLTVPKGTVTTLALECNVSGAATSGDTVAWSITGAQVGAMTVTGVTSTNSVTATGSATGGTMTIGTATLVASTDSSSPSYAVAGDGTNGVTVGVYKFRATNDSINLQRLSLQLTNTASSSSSDLVLVHIFGPNNTEVGQATFTGGNTFATSTLSTPILVPRDVDTLVTIKADLATIGNSAAVNHSGDLIAVDVNSNDVGGTYGTGVNSGTKVNATGSTAVSGVRMMASFPTLAVVTGTNALPSNAVADGRLMRFGVTASNSGSVSIAKLTLNLATSSATVTNVNVYGFTDSAFSQPISGVNTGGQLMQNSVNTSTYVSSPNIAVYPQTTSGATTTVVVPAGTTRYFEVRGTVTAASGATNYSVVTTLKGDTAYPAVNNTYYMTTLTGTSSTNGLGGPTAGDAGSNSTLSNFLWSPNSTTTAATSDVDWTNGYGLQGLPSNGIIQSRTN